MFSAAVIDACHPVKLNLESERKEDENVDGDESGPKDYISDVRESSLWASIRDYLTPLGVLATRTAGLEVELCEVVWRICCLVVLSHDERWK